MDIVQNNRFIEPLARTRETLCQVSIHKEHLLLKAYIRPPYITTPILQKMIASTRSSCGVGDTFPILPDGARTLPRNVKPRFTESEERAQNNATNQDHDLNVKTNTFQRPYLGIGLGCPNNQSCGPPLDKNERSSAVGEEITVRPTGELSDAPLRTRLQCHASWPV